MRKLSAPLRRLGLLSSFCLCVGCAGNHTAADGGDGGGGQAADAGPFEADSPRTYVHKVKALLTGGVAGADELAQVEGNAAALAPLVRGWLRTPAARQVLQDFFADAFQQSQASADALGDLYDQMMQPDPNLVLNLRQSFARTALDFADTKTPFNSVASTTRYMMTTAMMVYYAYTDTSVRDDAYQLSNRWYTANPNLTFVLEQARGPVDLTAAANAAGPDYMTFYVPNLHAGYVANQNATVEAAEMASCGGVDPVRIDRTSVNGGGAAMAASLYRFFTTGSLSYSKPSVADPNKNYSCNLGAAQMPFLSPADYNDWREVTVRAPVAGEAFSSFFDLPTLRAGNVLVLDAPRVGFFTTPAFLAQYPSNTSNTSRATTNQALIAGLGGQVDGSAQLPVTFPTAVDPTHAANPACFGCHQSLDPMRQYFRRSYSVTYSKQTNRSVFTYPAGFSFAGVTGAGDGVADFAQLLASHPNFATAWVVKLCSWATSTACLATDPEVVRIAGNFRASNFDFYAMAEELLSSPLVTYASSTASARTNGKQASIARRHQLCAVLNARLGLTDACDRDHQRDDGGNSVPSRTASMAGDLYVRGGSDPLYLTTPDPFYGNNLENVCALLASQLVDAKPVAWVTSDDPNAALAQLTGQLMGLTADEAPAMQLILRQHFDAVKAATQSPTQALRSSFVAACRSPLVAGLGTL